jgi:hypothetical protein
MNETLLENAGVDALPSVIEECNRLYNEQKALSPTVNTQTLVDIFYS